MSGIVTHFVGGKAWEGSSPRRGDVFNPATGERSRQVMLGGAAEVDAAVRAASAAFPDWAATPPLSRARILMKFLGLLEREGDALAKIITSEHGKVLSDAKGE